MWSNHITKFYARYIIDPKWSADTSVIAYWGYPGGEDMAQRNEAVWAARTAVGGGSKEVPRDPGYDDPWGPSIFVNAGLGYKPKDDLEIRFDAYNLLGWIDEELNKRIYLGSSAYRSSAPAFGVSMRYKF